KEAAQGLQIEIRIENAHKLSARVKEWRGKRDSGYRSAFVPLPERVGFRPGVGPPVSRELIERPLPGIVAIPREDAKRLTLGSLPSPITGDALASLIQDVLANAHGPVRQSFRK